MSNRIWTVEYEFVETKYQAIPMRIAFFKTEEEANEFCKKETTDGVVLWMDEIEE